MKMFCTKWNPYSRRTRVDEEREEEKMQYEKDLQAQKEGWACAQDKEEYEKITMKILGGRSNT